MYAAGVLALELRLMGDYPQLLSGLAQVKVVAVATDASIAVSDPRTSSS